MDGRRTWAIRGQPQHDNDRGRPFAFLVEPSSVALVGATDKSSWSANTFYNLHSRGFAGRVHLVNLRTETVHAARAHHLLTDIGEPVDLAFVVTPTDAVLDVVREGADCGIQSYVILTPGFDEAGVDGLERQTEFAGLAASRSLSILGPNGIGFVNAAKGVMPYALHLPQEMARGSVALVSQSGAMAHSLVSFAHASNIGFSFVVSMGNEATVTVSDVMSYLAMIRAQQ